jgi:hypothetical protein
VDATDISWNQENDLVHIVDEIEHEFYGAVIQIISKVSSTQFLSFNHVVLNS